MMTIAPEKFTEEEINYMLTNGIVISIGHSNGSYEEVEKVLKQGA